MGYVPNINWSKETLSYQKAPGVSTSTGLGIFAKPLSHNEFLLLVAGVSSRGAACLLVESNTVSTSHPGSF